MEIHYALQTCDVAFNQAEKRFCCETKAELIRKCVTSFFISVKTASELQPHVKHNIMIFDDNSTKETVEFLEKIIKKFSSDNIKVNLTGIESRSVMGSIRHCYEWLLANGKDLVYQVQDDYLFEKNAITETIDIFFRLSNEVNTQAIITPYNAPYLWSVYYKNKTAPRTIFFGAYRYWIQIYDISCSFLTSHKVLTDNKDLLEVFLSMNPKDPDLEKLSLNKILVQRGVLAVCPFESIALHMQTDYEKDPYVDWKKLWESVDENIIDR